MTGTVDALAFIPCTKFPEHVYFLGLGRCGTLFWKKQDQLRRKSLKILLEITQKTNKIATLNHPTVKLKSKVLT
jgi:hypothetical protein